VRVDHSLNFATGTVPTMEDLIGQLSAGSSNILFLVGLSEENPSSSQHLLYHISQIQKKCRQVFVVLFVNREDDVTSSSNSSSSSGDSCRSSSIDTSSLNKDQVIVIDCSQSSKSPILQHWLKLCKYSFLIDMYFSIEKATGQLSPTTSDILQHFSASQADSKIVCLHSETMLHHNKNERGSGKRKKKQNDAKLANDPAKLQGIKTLTSAFEGLTISHMVGDPQQVLSLMSWSVDTLHHLSHDVMRMSPPEAVERGADPTESTSVTLAPVGTYSLHCVSEVFLPLLKHSLNGGVAQPQHSPESSTQHTHSMSSIADSMLEMSSPERRHHSMKRFREDDSGQQLSFHSYTGGASEHGGTALKRSHTLSTIRETSSPATSVDQSRSGSSGGGPQTLPLQGHALKRSLSEGKAVRAHPPRPPPASNTLGSAGLPRLGGGDEYGRSFMCVVYSV